MRRLSPIAILLGVLAFASAGCSTSKPGEKVVSPLPTKVTGTLPKVTPVSTSVPAQYKKEVAACVMVLQLVQASRGRTWRATRKLPGS